MVINNIAAGSPALAGGLAVGDVVLAVNGHDIDDPEGMRFRLATLPMGSDAHLTVLRGTEQRGIDVRLVPPPETPPRDATDIGGNTPLTGATLANLNPALSEELAMHHGASGVVVTRIKRGSIAQRFQIQPGDLILRVNDHPVASVADARQSLAAAAGGWRITLSRDGQTMTLQIGG